MPPHSLLPKALSSFSEIRRRQSPLRQRHRLLPLRHRSAIIDCRLPEPGPLVYACEVQLQQVLVNLLRNACDAIDDRTSPEIQVRVKLDGDRVYLTVEDNGPGIDRQHGERVFDTFYTTKPKGMGMGLSISKSIIESHHGRLRLDPQSARGARFQVELPARDHG